MPQIVVYLSHFDQNVKNFVTENPFITEVTESTESTGNHLSVYNWEIVDGWFTEYPLSIGMNRLLIFDQFSVWLKNPISDLLQIIKRLMNVWKPKTAVESVKTMMAHGNVERGSSFKNTAQYHIKPENFHNRLWLVPK